MQVLVRDASLSGGAQKVRRVVLRRPAQCKQQCMTTFFYRPGALSGPVVDYAHVLGFSSPRLPSATATSRRRCSSDPLSSLPSPPVNSFEKTHDCDMPLKMAQVGQQSMLVALS